LSDYLADLNPEQKRAVLHYEGPLLVFAGAGSGKTRVLTRRIAHLIKEHRVHPSSILAVTFTNKAAREMKERVQKLFNGSFLPLWISTFHASCARILRADAKYLNYTERFVIYDSADSLAAMKRVFNKKNVDQKLIDPRGMLFKIDRAKNDYLFPDSFLNDRYMAPSQAELQYELYQGYQDELLSANAMDFGDLLCNVVTLFKLEPKILERYQNQFRFLLIDEYQDTNKVQYELVHLLAEKSKNLCVVGDDDQSIYAFRGATVQNILNFKRDFPDAAVVTLDENYRSSKFILDAANSVIEKNQNRQYKKMRTSKEKGEFLYCYHGFDERDEADFVSREIVSLVEGGRKLEEIAVFYRTNAQSRAIEELFCENGLAYQIFGGHKFYDRKEIKDLLAYFRLLLNNKDNEAFFRIINVPARGLGATSVGGLTAYAQEKKLALYPALLAALEEEKKPAFLSNANRKKFESFVKLVAILEEELILAESKLEGEVEDILRSERVNALADLFNRIADKSGYLAELKAEGTPEADSRIENIFELSEVAGEFIKRAFQSGDRVTVQDFLERASLSSDLDGENSKEVNDEGEKANQKEKGERKARNAVSMMTLHLAKGLEFPIVFLVGLEEGVLPHVRSLDDRQALEEERRLCYVGITRAMERLYISRAQNRQTFGRGNFYSGVCSRFLDDIPLEVLQEKWSELAYRDRFE
jgi:DNA helicase-2/ATP-dependent DNA helicase PcrA